MPNRTIVAALALFLAAAAADAQLAREEQKRAKALLKGTLYLRIDVPCETGRHPYGIYHRPLVEVSPTGANTDVGNDVNLGWFHAGSTDWSVRVNDAMELDEAEFEDSTVELELEGVGASEDRDTALKFVGIHSYDDFMAAFDRTFSRRPLQEEHADWPDEIRRAIADRRLLEGMTKRQVYYVTGQPETVEKADADGREIETWTLRAGGLRFGFWGARDSGSSPAQRLRFEDGRLALGGSQVSGARVELDD